jgi:hypothetical protein
MIYHSHRDLELATGKRVVRGRVVAVTPPTFVLMWQSGNDAEMG